MKTPGRKKHESTIQCKYASHHFMGILAPASASQKCPSGFGAEVGISTNRTTVSQKIWWSHQKNLDHNRSAEEFVSFTECLQIWSHLRLLVCQHHWILPEFFFGMNLLQMCWCYLALVGGCYFDLFWTSIFQYSPRDPWTSKKMEDYFPSHVNLFIG